MMNVRATCVRAAPDANKTSTIIPHGVMTVRWGEQNRRVMGSQLQRSRGVFSQVGVDATGSGCASRPRWQLCRRTTTALGINKAAVSPRRCSRSDRVVSATACPGKRRHTTTFPEAVIRRWMNAGTQLHKGMKTRYKK